MSETGMQRQKRPSDARTINCDQVAWLLDCFDRYLPKDRFPAVSQQREMQQYGMLYEVMEVADLWFEDDSARHNGTPPKAREQEYPGENPSSKQQD